MVRKLVFTLSLVAAVAVVTGCKDDQNTSMNVGTKGMYQQTQQNQQYKENVGTAGATTTTP